MASNSPLTTICQLVQQVCAHANANTSIFQKNEAATRAALIDPILRALGWDTANVRMVEPEKSLGNELRVDYLLRDANGHPALVLEAKCLNQSLDKYGYVGKILGYALALDVQTVCITDGLSWHIHPNLHNGKSEPLMFTLSESNPVPAALLLIQWLDAARSGHGIQLSPIDQPPTPTPPPIAGASAKPTKSVTKAALEQPKKLKSAADFIELSQLKSLELPAGQKPKLLRLPNGAVKPITTWKDILLEVCQLALDTNPHIPIPFPDKAGKKRALLSPTKQPVGASTKATYKGQPVFIGTNYSRKDCIANTLYALQQLPPNQQATTLAVSF